MDDLTTNKKRVLAVILKAFDYGMSYITVGYVSVDVFNTEDENPLNKAYPLTDKDDVVKALLGVYGDVFFGEYMVKHKPLYYHQLLYMSEQMDGRKIIKNLRELSKILTRARINGCYDYIRNQIYGGPVGSFYQTFLPKHTKVLYATNKEFKKYIHDMIGNVLCSRLGVDKITK